MRSRPRLGTVLTSTIVIASLLATSPARACDLCAIYTGTLGQQDRTGAWIGLGEQYTNFATIRTDGHKEPNTHDEWLHSSITQLLIGYSFTSYLSLQANVPLISREYRRVESGTPEPGDANGLGDVSLLAKLTAFSAMVGPTLLHVEFLAGVKTPTGNSDRLAEELMPAEEVDASSRVGMPARAAPHHEEHESAVHGHDLALGSGSVDGIFGLGLHGGWRRVFASASLQYVLRGHGDFHYTYADDFTWETGPGVFLLTDDRYTAALRLVVSGEHKGKDEQLGVVAEDTAITAVYVGPGLSATWTSALQAQLAVDIPVLQDETGTQIVADYRLRGGLVWRF